MADKKVERSRRERPLTPTDKMRAALSDSGTVNMAEPVHDKGRSALVDKFREREERWRQEQAMHDRAKGKEEHVREEEAQSSKVSEQEKDDDVQKEGGDA